MELGGLDLVLLNELIGCRRINFSEVVVEIRLEFGMWKS